MDRKYKQNEDIVTDINKADYNVVHQGFDIVIVSHKETEEQLCTTPKAMGLTKRKRPNSKY